VLGHSLSSVRKRRALRSTAHLAVHPELPVLIATDDERDDVIGNETATPLLALWTDSDHASVLCQPAVLGKERSHYCLAPAALRMTVVVRTWHPALSVRTRRALVRWVHAMQGMAHPASWLRTNRHRSSALHDAHRKQMRAAARSDALRHSASPTDPTCCA